jgi:23S rRNA (guanosine2251-2'-O)-methyltransferase
MGCYHSVTNAMKQLILIAHNLRSTHNVGSLLRTADGLGLTKVVLSGYTPYPLSSPDTRLPHLAKKIDAQIVKTALGAEKSLAWEHHEAVEPVISNLRAKGYAVYALEQTADSIALPTFAAPDKLVLIVGREVEGIEPEILALCDASVEIPMLGKKESFNVVQAAAMALYHCRYSPL